MLRSCRAMCSGARGPQPEIPHETGLTQPSPVAQRGGPCLPMQETPETRV